MVKSIRDSNERRQREKVANLTLQQRNTKLKEASADYLKGDITEDELEEVEEDLATDFSEAAYNIASPAKSFWRGLKELIGFQKRK